MSGKIIIISGPAGVGKSTTARLFAEKLKKSAYVNGDSASFSIIQQPILRMLSREFNQIASF